MTRTTITLLLLSIGLTFLSACDRGAPQIAPETTRLDLGDVPNGQIVSRDVVVRNDGDAALVVQNLSTSCGCTTATLEPMRVEPGHSATLVLTFDSGAHGPDLTGFLVRQIYIKSNDPAHPELVLELSANVTPPHLGSN